MPRVLFKKVLDVIVDVETIGIFSPQANRGTILSNAIFNVGIKAIERTSGLEVMAEEVGIMDIFEFPEHRIMDFYRCNFTGKEFTMRFDDFKLFLSWYADKIKALKENYTIQYWSYNADFDSRAFIDNAKLYNIRMTRPSNWNCLLALSNTLIQKHHYVQYVNWCIEAEYVYGNWKFISPKGNIRTRAETVWCYITNDVNFKEAHKGLQDCHIEAGILKWSREHKGWTKSVQQSGRWTIVNENALPFQSISELETERCLDVVTYGNLQKLNEIRTRKGSDLK